MVTPFIREILNEKIGGSVKQTQENGMDVDVMNPFSGGRDLTAETCRDVNEQWGIYENAICRA